MPTASDFSFKVKDNGLTTFIPDDDIARLMYYLNCVTLSLGLDILQDDLVRFERYNLLSPTRIAVVFKTAVELSPEVFLGKTIFLDNAGEVTKDSPNEFLSISAACNIVSLQSDIVIAGRVQNVKQVMFFNSSWLKYFYTDPVERVARAMLRTKLPTPFVNTPSPATTQPNIPPRNPPSTTKPPTGNGPPHNTPPPLPPRTQAEQATFHNPPPPYTETEASPFFYKTMSVTGLKTFLKQRGVEFDDVLDKETLCRRAWDTHCDCMTITELNTFLSKQDVSTVGCRDVNSRRQKAKSAFEPPTRPSRPPASSDTAAIRFRKDDTVVLTGLNRGEMNGKTATVISIDHAEGKALVRVEALDRTFKIKLENLRMQEDVEELE